MATNAASSLQIAQILADLQTLQNADPTAATALLSANKSISAALIRKKSSVAIAPTPPLFGNLGRRVVPPQSTDTPPSLLRNESTASSGYFFGSGAESPTAGNADGSAGEEMDPDMKRAKTLLELFEMRGKFKQMGDTGLTRSKARVDAVVAKYAEMELAEREKKARAKHLGVYS